MSTSTALQAEQQHVKRLREERYFDVPPSKAMPLIQAAVEHATGAELVELADGMWEGRVPLESGYREVTVRALPTERGTNVEILMEDHASMMATAMWGTFAIILAMLIIPLFFMIAYSQRKQREQAKARLIQMHKTWKEITSALGAPKRASYRDAPRRIYAPEPPPDPVEVEAEREALAAEEQEAQQDARV